jgi:hypothetical protein
VERKSEEVVAQQDMVLKVKAKTKTKDEIYSWRPTNWTVQFPKPDHPISSASGQKKPLRTTTPETAVAPRWCPPSLTPNQRRRIQRMRAQKMRKEVAEKERGEHFNDIRLVIPMRQEWRVKEKADTLAPTTSNDDMDLLDDDEAPLIKDGSSPPTRKDINMVFMLPTKFRGAEDEVAQMCLNPKEAMLEKPEESSQHLKSLYVRGHINRKPISRMLIDGGTVVNLMPYSVFKKIGREDDELVKTNLTLNRVRDTLMEARGVISMELTVRSKLLTTAFFVVEV